MGNHENNPKVAYLVLLLVLLIAGGLYLYSTNIQPYNTVLLPDDKPDINNQTVEVANTKISTSTTVSTPIPLISYSYLFESEREPNTSNIVGYFAGGAFAWYVPDWLVNNWEMKRNDTEIIEFTAKIKKNIDDFSDISMRVSTSTELNNAASLAYNMQLNIPKDEMILNEVLLNKHSGDWINIQMGAETRIYHIVAYTRDFLRITDLYYMDGNGKTLQITFESKVEYFPQFSEKIRDLVERIGELKAPQG